MEYNKALYKAAALCSQQERCTSDIRKKLVNWELTEEECNQAVDYLTTEKYLDDERFAFYFVRDKFRFNGWGKIKIKYQLKQKGISSVFIDNALDEIDNSEYQTKLAELLHAKKKQIKNKDYWKTKSSMARFAQSRGFEPNLIFNCIDDILSDESKEHIDN